MKILWHGIACTRNTGYGYQTSLFVPALEDAGHDVAISAMFYQYDTGVDANNVVNFATGQHKMFGNDMVWGHYNHYQPDIVLSMCDAWVCKPTIFEKFAWFPFVMADSAPLSWENRSVLPSCRLPIAPTEHTGQLLEDFGLDSYYVPLAIDTDVFKPSELLDATSADSGGWREYIGGRYDNREMLAKAVDREIGRNTLLAVSNMANHSAPSRKNFAGLFKAWSLVEKERPDSVLYVHTEKAGVQWEGEFLPKWIELYGCKNVVFAPQYEYMSGVIGAEFLAAIYDAADVYVHSSTGEGFGLPIAEAQACGCPVVVPNFGSMAEVGAGGTLVSGQMVAGQSAGTERFLVDPRRLADAVLDIELDRSPEESEMHRKNVLRYDIKNVMADNMVPVLKDIERKAK